ncbi:aalpha-mannosidase [Pycnococcus provasolii]
MVSEEPRRLRAVPGAPRRCRLRSRTSTPRRRLLASAVGRRHQPATARAMARRGPALGKTARSIANKTFVYVEMAFFTMWWSDQSDATKQLVKQLVQNKQLAFANGGYCMHDEATPDYVAMLDQTAVGHRFLRQEFDYTPSVGWQVDPFGHSHTQATLLTRGV